MTAINEWHTAEHAGAYLAHGTAYPPHRVQAEEVVVAELPERVGRVLDLGCGDARFLDVVRTARPDAAGVAVDFSPTMLDAAQRRFTNSPDITVVEHNLDQPLPSSVSDAAEFDVVVSGFAIHHLTHERKRGLYEEVFALLRPGGLFANLEHVSSPSPRLRQRFWEAMGQDPNDEDPANKLLDPGTQLEWLREIGFVDVDCLWRWRELALMVGTRPAAVRGTC
ncbi:MAG: class I SAM-dependent methyltransferase [Acidimicrobiales bacterium]